MNDPGKQRIRSAIIHLMGVILCALALWALRRWPIPALAGNIRGILPLKNALYLLLFAPLLIWFLWRLFLVAADGKSSLLAGLFVIGVLFVGLGLGMHDTASNVGAFGNTGWTPQALAARHFYDEILGHLVFWLGFILTTVTTGLGHINNPMPTRQTWSTCGVFAVLGIPLTAVMLGNLMFENTGRDLMVIGMALGTLVAVQAWKHVELRRLPLLCMLYPAYSLAIGGTLLYWAVRGH
jgi:hypothetical protein